MPVSPLGNYVSHWQCFWHDLYHNWDWVPWWFRKDCQICGEILAYEQSLIDINDWVDHRGKKVT